MCSYDRACVVNTVVMVLLACNSWAYLSAAMKIQASDSSAQLLRKVGGFTLDCRGTVQVKVRTSAQLHKMYIHLFAVEGTSGIEAWTLP